MQQRNPIRTIVISVIIIFMALIGYSIYTLVAHAGKVQTAITVYPNDASVMIDGKKASSGTTYLTPGKHTFRASKSGFADATLTLSISDDIKTAILLPSPISAEAIAWSQQPDVSATRETLGGQLASIRGMSLDAQYPLIHKLPYIDIEGPFALDYGYKGADNSEIYFLIHDSTPNGRQAAFKWIREQGIDPATLDIRYDEYQNPLTTGGDS